MRMRTGTVGRDRPTAASRVHRGAGLRAQAEGTPHDAVPARPPRVESGPPGSMRGEHLRVLLDELSAREALERAGVRWYDALLAQVERGTDVPSGIGRAEVRALRQEEAEHAQLARGWIRELGGDPRSARAAHDLEAEATLGAPRALGSADSGAPSGELASCLDAVLRAELADHDGWTVLLALARLLGRDELVRRFERVLARERRQLRIVRGWVQRLRAST